MELKDYIKLLTKDWYLVIGFGLVAALLGYYLAITARPQYQGLATFTVTQKAQSANNNLFVYDNYYSVSASAYLAETLNSIITSPNTVVSVFDSAGFPAPANDYRKLLRVFRSTKPNQYTSAVPVSVNAGTKDDAKKIMESLSNFLKADFSRKQQSGTLSKDFGLDATPVIVLEKLPNASIQTGIYSIAGIIIGSVMVVIKDYLLKN